MIVTKQSSTTFSDKEQVWADNASSSPFFGHAYVCLASFRSQSEGMALPQPLIVATSTDGGSTWTQKQVTSASNNPFNTKQGFGRSGCTVRTDSHGVVYVFANQFAVGMPGQGSHIMVKSFDGGKTWTRPVNIGLAVDTCFSVQFDGTSFRCVMDGVAGARDDLSAAPSVDIANGAPTGAGATNEILRTWVDGRDAVAPDFSPVHVFVSYSTDGGSTWSAPAAAESAGDRGYYSAIAISPSGTDAYLVYNAFTTPFRNDTTSPRTLVGVVKHADIGANGAPGAWSELHRSAPGDPRGSAQNNLWLEFLGDYVYAVATGTYGAGRVERHAQRGRLPCHRQRGGQPHRRRCRTARLCRPRRRRSRIVRRPSATRTYSAVLSLIQPHSGKDHCGEGGTRPPGCPSCFA